MKTSMKFCSMVLFALILLPISTWAGTVSGLVTSQRTGLPIANAKVLISGGPYQDSGFTDMLGQYSILNVPAGNYTLIATAPLFNSIIRTGVAVPATALTQNFNLQVTATIRGTATNSANGNPVVGAQVVLTLPSSGTFVPETTMTDARGGYLFDSVSNSGGTTYRITVTGNGFQTAFNNTVIITDGIRAGIADFSLIASSIGSTTGSITGTVASGNSGVLLVGAQVVLSQPGYPNRTTVTDSLGHYRFDTVLVQTGYTLTASAVTYNNGTQINVNVILGQTTVVDLNLASNLGTAWGRVLQVNTTQPIANALVRILDNNGVLLGSGVADAQGYYNIYNITPGGNYTMIATAPLYNSIIRAGISVPNNWFNENFNLQVTATIRGTISNATNGNSIAGARVVLTLPSSGTFLPETVFTDAQGAYLFDSVSNGNNYRLTVSAANFQSAVNNSVTITDARRSGLADISLIPAGGSAGTGSISGVIASANSGVPIAGATVVITSVSGGSVLRTTLTDSNGIYYFSALSDSFTYSITASAATFNNLTTGNAVSVIAGQTTVVNLNPQSSSGILPFRGISRAGTHWVNGRLTMDLAPSTQIRIVEAYGVDGVLMIRASIPAGVTHWVFPAPVTREARLRIRP